MYLCGPPAERPRWVIPAAVLSHSKHTTTGWLSKPLSGICLIWSFCLHLSSAPRLKAAALPLFASLLGSEENDNNEAWRQSTASHTNIHTYTKNTDDTHNLTHPVLQQAHTHTHTCIFTHKHTCNVKWMQVAISFSSCHTKCANMSVVYICNLLQSLHWILYYMPLFYILL